MFYVQWPICSLKSYIQQNFSTGTITGFHSIYSFLTIIFFYIFATHVNVFLFLFSSCYKHFQMFPKKKITWVKDELNHINNFKYANKIESWITLSKAQNPQAWFSIFCHISSVVHGIVVDGAVIVDISNFFFG